MNKQETIKAIALKTGLTQVAVQKAINGLEEVVFETLANNEKVQLTGFLTIKPAARAARKGFNPLQNEAMDIAATVGVSAKAGEKLKKAVEGLTYEQVKGNSDEE